MRLDEKAARDVLLTRAIESEDSDAQLLTREDRQYATGLALTSSRLGDAHEPRQIAAFLGQRSALALDRLVARYPQLNRARTLDHWPGALGWALPLAALAIGLATNAIDGDRLNILAFPLLGMLAWNLAVYVWLLVGWARRRTGHQAATPVPAMIGWMVRPASARLAGHPTLERAVVRFGRDWADAAAPLTRSRLGRTLHFSAATFALGIVAGMLGRARYTAEYSAGWAGTWAGAETEIAALLQLVLGPASALTGIGLPTVERLRELRGAGENAGDWLILWIVTAALFVILPRLVLAIGNLGLSATLKRRFFIPHDFYVRRLLRDALGRPRNVRVIPYGFQVAASATDNLARLLVETLGEKTRLETLPAVAYGDEDDWISGQAGSLAGSDQVVILFNLASTPESENHAAFALGLRQRLADQAELMVLIDDSAFTHKLRGQASAARRLEERLQTWRNVLAPVGIEPISVSLDRPHDVERVRQLEQALLRSAPAR